LSGDSVNPRRERLYVYEPWDNSLLWEASCGVDPHLLHLHIVSSDDFLDGQWPKNHAGQYDLMFFFLSFLWLCFDNHKVWCKHEIVTALSL